MRLNPAKKHHVMADRVREVLLCQVCCYVLEGCLIAPIFGGKTVH